MKYSKITLTAVVKEEASQQVVQELKESLDLIEAYNIIYSDEITVEPAEKPVDAALLDCGDSDDDSEGSPE
jgi:predicted dinucleotide-binding enzyme